MAWFKLDPNDVFNGDEGVLRTVEWLDEFTRWIEGTFDGRVSRYDRSPGNGSSPIPDEIIGDLFTYWYENILSQRDSNHERGRA